MIDIAVQKLNAGKLIVYPTEAVFGLGCDPFNQDAVRKIVELKQRKNKAGLICVIGSIEQLELLAAPLNAENKKKVLATWPGHTSWILPAKYDIPEWLVSNENTICVRFSAHPIVQQLCLNFNKPIISTSANLSGFAPATTISQARNYFNNSVDYYLDAPLGKETSVSTILSIDKSIIRN